MLNQSPEHLTPVTPASLAFPTLPRGKRNRLYRIFIRPDELVFIWAGSGSEGLAGARAAVGDALDPMLDPIKKNESRLEVLNRTPLDQLIGDHPDNIRASIADFEQIRIRPRSDDHARGFSDHSHQARLFLRHHTLGKFRLGIASLKDTQIAFTELPRIFGDKCQVEIKWPEQEQKCQCRFCRLRPQESL